LNKEVPQHTFTPSAFISNFTPLIVILDTTGAGVHFEYKMWNVLTIKDSLSLKESHSLIGLIKNYSEEHECEDHIYIYAKETSLYRTLLYALESMTHSLYLDAPNLLDSDIGALKKLKGMYKIFPKIYLSYPLKNKTSTDTLLKSAKISFQKQPPKISYENSEKRLQEVLDMLAKMGY